MLIHVSGNFRISRMYLKEMLAMGINPNTWTYNAIIWLHKHSYQKALAIMQIEMVNQNERKNKGLVVLTKPLELSGAWGGN